MPFLDANSTTKPTPAVVDAVLRGLTDCWQNPSSVHRAGQGARQQVELARHAVAELIGARAREVTFTSCATEALDLAVRGVLAARGVGSAGERVLITSRVEHAAVRDLAEDLARTQSVRVEYLDMDARGVYDVGAGAERIRAHAGARPVVCVQWANNETGAVQPVEALAEACKQHGATLIVDGTQWVGKEPTSVRAPAGATVHARAGWCDALVFSPHKFHGPKGVGVLWARPGLRLSPRILGTQELGRRGGTENVPGIMGAGVAAQECGEWLAQSAAREGLAALRDEFERSVVDACAGAVVIGPAGKGQRLWNTSTVAFPRLEAEAILLGLSERGVEASAGAACSSGSLEPSPVLLAFGVPAEVAHGAVRFSFDRFAERDEVLGAAAVIAEVVGRLRQSLP